MQKAINAIGELAVEAGKPSWNWSAPPRNDELVGALKGAIGNNLAEAFQIRDMLQRRVAIAALR
jgi:polyribonucleotide nucleotidyltransferase